MSELFGLPMSTLMWFFGIAMLVAIGLTVLLGLRHPVLVRLGVRNIPRRWERSALIMLGLTLATTIITTALATGDTIAHTARSEVLAGLGAIDEIVSSQAESDIEVTGESTRTRYFPESAAQAIRDQLAGAAEVDGITGAIWENIGVQNLQSRQTEPRVLVFGADPAHMTGFGDIRGTGRDVLLSDLQPGEVYLNRTGAEELQAAPGSQLALYAAGQQQTATVRDVVEFEGGGTDPFIMMTLADAQRLLQRPGQVAHVIISNSGDRESGVVHTDAVIRKVQPALDALGLAIEPTKQEDLKAADEAGATFGTFFVTFGSFSIAAGILLIFLIFVMLSAERKPEMGIARAIGTERLHLVEMFLFEGLVYDVLAALAGAALGVVVAYIMVSLLAVSIGDFGVDIDFTTSSRSMITAYAIGVVLTFIVVVVSAWRVSVLNIVTAIRNLPDPVSRHAGRASLAWGIALLILGVLVTMSGLSGKQMAPFLLGTSLVILAMLPLSRWLGVPDRIAYTAVGGLIVVWWLLPPGILDPLLPEMSSDFNVFVIGGLISVTGATWVVIYNSDLITAAVLATLGRVRQLAPVLRTALVYPLANRFRTGVTLSMFTLVVFTMVVGTVVTGAFTQAFNDIGLFGGGYHIRLQTVPANPIPDIGAALQQADGLVDGDITAVASESTALVDVQQTGTSREAASYPLRGFDDAFFDNTTYEFGIIARGYGSPREVWQAVKNNPKLAVIDAFPVPTRNNYNFGGAPTDFRLEGLFIEDRDFEPIPIRVTDPATGAATDLTVIAVLKGVSPDFMIGILTSQELVASSFPEQSAASTHLIQVRDGADAAVVAETLESAFLANGMEATVLQEALDDLVAVNGTFNYIIQGFLGLGLIVGVAALGVISARTVVERRQEIGVMRAIGFEQRMVQLSFLLESTMVALAGMALGTAMGLVISYNVIEDSRSGGWENLQLSVPWGNFLIIYVLVYGAALATSYVPALQASRIYPAEALRYE